MHDGRIVAVLENVFQLKREGWRKGLPAGRGSCYQRVGDDAGRGQRGKEKEPDCAGSYLFSSYVSASIREAERLPPASLLAPSRR